MNAPRQGSMLQGPQLRLKPMSVLLLTVIAAYQLDARAGDTTDANTASVQFENEFLMHGDGHKVDVSRFEKGNVVMPGTYNVDIFVNDERVARADVPFQAASSEANAQPCFDEKTLARIGVDLKKLDPENRQRLEAAGACVRIDEIVAGASSSFDFGEQRLQLSIPQISLLRKARGYVTPDLWDSGVTAGWAGYNFNLYSNHSRGAGFATQGYLGLNTGLNLGNWHFRHDGSYTFDSHGAQKYQDIATYLQRDVPSLSSQLTIGEAYTTGDLFDSTAFRGVRLATDDRMLPDSLRGYAPTVRGIARSNAKVTIRQNNVILHETTVAPGAFEIDDLYATGYGGDLTVSVEEADGSTQTFTVPYAAVPLSLRPGVNRYSFVAGVARNAQLSGNPVFGQGTWQRGINNLLTAYGGVTVAEGYGSVLAGGAFNTPIGAIGLDGSMSSTQLPGEGRKTGSSVRISYAKNLPDFGTNFSLAAYRYSTGGYFGLNEALYARGRRDANNGSNGALRQRNRASVTLNQQLGEKHGNLSLTASTTDYWNRSGSDVNYAVGYSNAVKNIGYSVSANRMRNSQGRMDTLYYANVTIPLGKAQPMTASASVSHDSNGRTQAQTTLSGSLNADNTAFYGVTVDHASGNGASSTTGGSANVSYRNPYAEFTATAGSGTGFSQGSVGVRGAVVAHPGGVSLSQPLSDTFGIVEAPEAAGASVTNSAGVRVDSRGYAVVPYLTPYVMNDVQLDPKGLSTDVELQETSQQVAPRAGSVALLKYATVVGRSAVLDAHQSNGKPLPFGAPVFDQTGNEIGTVGQASRVFARGLLDSGELQVKWGDDAASICRIHYELPTRDSRVKADSYQRIEAVCK